MRRRRRSPMRRRRPMGPPPEHNRAHRALQRAHRSMENADYANAADIFERLARGAHDRGILRQAPRLYLQAGRAHMLAGNKDQGSDLLRQGLNIFAEAQRWAQLHQAGSRVVSELDQWGHDELAREFDEWLQGILPEKPETYQRTGVKKSRPQLPIHCPSCGGPIRGDDVEWLDANTAECPYCGSGVR